MKKIILVITLALGSVGLYFSCSNSNGGGSGVNPGTTPTATDSTITLSIDGQPEIKYYVPFVSASKQADGKYAMNTVASASKTTTANGALSIIIKSVTNQGGSFTLQDNQAVLVLTTPQLPISGASNCKTNPQGSINITSVTEEKDKMVKGSYPGTISGNFTATLCELGDGKTHTITGSFKNLKTVFIDPSFLDGTGSITDANKDIKVSLNNAPEVTYTKILSGVTYVKTLGLSLFIGVSGNNDPTHDDGLMSISIDIPNPSPSSIKGTHIITKGTDPNLKQVYGEYKVEKNKNTYHSHGCDVVEGNITITDEFRKTTATTPGYFEGYISGTYSFKVCDGDGNSATVKGSFTKLYTVFSGDF